MIIYNKTLTLLALSILINTSLNADNYFHWHKINKKELPDIGQGDAIKKTYALFSKAHPDDKILRAILKSWLNNVKKLLPSKQELNKSIGILLCAEDDKTNRISQSDYDKDEWCFSEKGLRKFNKECPAGFAGVYYNYLFVAISKYATETNPKAKDRRFQIIKLLLENGANPKAKIGHLNRGTGWMQPLIDNLPSGVLSKEDEAKLKKLLNKYI